MLFGFGIAWFLLIKTPYVGVLVYGIAEASTAYLITKITDPPPPPQEEVPFVESQVKWQNKTQFLTLPLHLLDANNAKTTDPEPTVAGRATALPEKKFT